MNFKCWGIDKLLCLLAMPGWYRELLSKHNITIGPQPSWEGYSFPENVGKVDCIQLLALRGLTLDKADNCHDLHLTGFRRGLLEYSRLIEPTEVRVSLYGIQV